MNARRILDDVNLAEIAFVNEGQEIVLTFLSVIDGHEVAVVTCKGLLPLEYHTALSALPLYVGEVNYHEMGRAKAGRAKGSEVELTPSGPWATTTTCHHESVQVLAG